VSESEMRRMVLEDENRRLEDDLRRMRESAMSMGGMLVAAEQERDQLKAALRKFDELLDKNDEYLQHEHYCDAKSLSRLKCSCGYREFLEKLMAVQTQSKELLK
jgi:hypothetical protein